MNTRDPVHEGIAVIGLAGRFPGARDLDEFWRNLRDGVESVTFFTEAELQPSLLDGPVPAGAPNLVKARAVLERPEWFDAAFFGINPKEAELLDPQQRIFLECAAEALEHAGCNSENYRGSLGVFAGAALSTYMMNLISTTNILQVVGIAPTLIANANDYLTTRVSYKLNLRGPSLNVQTACSTSLVAVCLACQHLHGFQCDVALAGGVAVSFPQRRGLLHQEGAILAADGHCRPFDAQAAGTVSGDGAGVVVLKRLADAIADGDTIWAVIKGSALNNDGGHKIGYTAPSVDGQAEVIALAQAQAGVAPETISYVEAHGTATPLGDPIEIAGLTKAFGTGPDAGKYCALGSVKGNIGHLDAAAGIAGFIKTVLALHHEQLPPSLHFRQPNPRIDFAAGPFFVNAQLRAWPRGRVPRRAGVSSFGIGGTNAHVVLEEPPVAAPAAAATRPYQLLTLSARSSAALEAATERLARRIQDDHTLNLADAAFTLHAGRRHFEHRRMLVCDSAADLAHVRRTGDPRQIATGRAAGREPPVAFMFPGQGAQHINMARGLYETEPVFREHVDRACDLLQAHLEHDLRRILFPPAAREAAAEKQLAQTAFTQPALFVIEYALAQLWLGWGIRPQAMIGHSLGEYVAACLAGVFSLEDGLALIAARGRLLQAQPPGAMLAVRLPEAEITPLLGPQLSLAAINAPGACVASGPFDAIATLERQLAQRGTPGRRLATSHAFHSAMMNAALKPFARVVAKARLRPPRIRCGSNVTGTWLTAEQATDPEYWVAHVRQTVRFADGVGLLAQEPDCVLLEVGPGQTLGALARQHPLMSAPHAVVSSFEPAREPGRDSAAVLAALGRLWIAGAAVDWNGFHAHEERRRVPLPTYPFERKRHWIEPGALDGAVAVTVDALSVAVPPSGGPVSDFLPSLRPESEVPPEGGTTSKETANSEAPALARVQALFEELSGLELAEHTTRSFAALGFDSLFLMQVAAALERMFGVPVAFRDLLGEFNTLAALAARLAPGTDARALVVAPSGGMKAMVPPEGGTTNQGPAVQPMPASPAVVDEIAPTPLTEAQREIWYACQWSEAASCSYNESRRLTFHGAFDAGALQRAGRALADRHEALRTTFTPDGAAQVVTPRLEWEIPASDFSGLAPAGSRARLDALEAAEAAQPFDLTRGPLWRMRLAQVAPGEHALIVTIHHLVCDGHSWGILLRELAALYTAEAGGERARLKTPLQPGVYARARSAQLRGVARQAAEAYWVAQLGKNPPVLELPADRPAAAGASFAGAREACQLDAALRDRLRAVSGRHGGTLFTTLLAAYYVWLARLSGQMDVVVGVPVAERAMPGGETLVAHCVEFLPVRVRVDEETPWPDFLAHVKRIFVEAVEHRQCGFGRILQLLELGRDPGRLPLVAVTFNVDRLDEPLEFAGLRTEFACNPHGHTNVDLGLAITEVGGHLELECRYRAARFEAETIRRWLGHFSVLLEAIAAEPAGPVADLPLLSTSQWKRWLVDWNPTGRAQPGGKCVHALFEEQAGRTPDATAVVAGAERVNYRELNERADRLAEELRARKVGADSLVGVCLERTTELVVAVLAVLKAGGAYVPLDPEYPRERLAFIIADARAPVVITQAKLADLLPAGDAAVVLVDGDQRPPARQPAGAVAAAGNLAYVLYTSGSTGRPKGVAVEHRSVAALIAWAQQQYRPEEMRGVLASTSLCFDLSVFELFVPLACGGAVILAANALALPSLPAAREVTLINTVPSAIAELLRLGAIPDSARTLNLAGEPLAQDLVEQLYRLPFIRRVFDLYGPTEDTVYSTCALRWPGGRPTIGRPLENEQAYVLDERLRPVPLGVPGELFLGGDGLARGYWNRPELTAEKFIASPFVPGARLYRTGDRVRLLADASIEFLGRLDHQVKLRGYRIELGEIEAALRALPGVGEAVAVVWSPENNPRLAAYVAPAAGGATDPGAWRRALQEKLPAYMVPAAIVGLAALPRTLNGKVDRQALPPPEPAAQPATAYVAPATPTEETLARIWCELLRRERIGMHDDFFALGGHSLLVTQFIVRVREAFRVELTMRTVFQSPRIAALALAVEELLIAEISAMSEAEAQRCVGTA